MTFTHLEAEAARQRKLYAEDPDGFRRELYSGMRDRAALIERFFSLGASVCGNQIDWTLPGNWTDDEPISYALMDMAKDIRLAAVWLDEEGHEVKAPQSSARRSQGADGDS